jgi:hypothetical protein
MSGLPHSSSIEWELLFVGSVVRRAASLNKKHQGKLHYPSRAKCLSPSASSARLDVDPDGGAS